MENQKEGNRAKGVGLFYNPKEIEQHVREMWKQGQLEADCADVPVGKGSVYIGFKLP